MSFFTSRTAVTLGVATLAATTLVACGESGSDTPTITFAAVPAESSTTLEQTFGNITRLIEQETGVAVKFQNASDYAAVIEGMRAGQVDLASFGPFSYVIARDSGISMEAIVAPTNDIDEAPSYTSLAYVKKDSPVRSLEDLAGKKVCFVDQASTSGYLVPFKGLTDVGVDLDADLTVVMAGGHDASLLTLDSDGCDVAFAHDAMLTTLERSGQIEPGALRPVWESAPITEDPIAINLDTVDAELAEQITRVLREKANKPELVKAGICTSEEDCLLPEETEYGYVPVSDSDFDPIRDICRVTQAEACKAVD
ncbi:MAG: phosphate/phosphite/phosphonate ABC transporter substrate-binding protein [Corynebacterium humireducens]|jgi:phosphonate transport system substrate-binding protein|uniref:Phosphate/phosphite/phosphonate ABC transporter substrate-binding protein n=1 Tax=Corynebacterium humireducens TaxID=1223514 RepID=A0A7X6PM02_9CORY|nr:phosphate/phosphite/phosphonate ABC transporter substrate-binding protein [Corynebacterium humireducens]